MDTSETYIKMCEKAEEIQLGKKSVERGDSWCWKSYPEKVYFRAENSPLEMYDSRNKRESNNKIWLPRQDQLQEMHGRYCADELELRDVDRSIIMHSFIAFGVWINERYEEAPYVCNPTNVFASGEQLWLAFVMKEKYNKVWNGEDWIKA